MTVTADGTVWISQNEPALVRLRFNQDRFVSFDVPPGYGEFIVTGPDGALWFTAQAQNLIGRITTAGEVTTTPVPTPNAGVLGITNGPDGALWFVERLGDKIGRITTDGRVQEFTIPTPGAQPADIATGPDGALWFTESGNNLLAKIGRLDTSGNFEEFPLPDPTSLPLGITAGPDGAMWFAESSGNKIGRIDVTTRVITEYPLPRAGMGPEYIVTGPDQNLWFTTFNGTAIGRITPSGVITTRNAIGLTLDIAVGSDGNLWYSGFTEGTIGQASLSTFELTTQFFGLGTIHGIIGGPDGNVWFTNLNGGRIGYYRLLTALALASQAVTPTAPPGGDITMSVVATNSGPDDAGAPTIAVQLDPQVGLVGFIPPPGWTCTFTEQALGNRGSCTGPQLRAGESVTLTITARLSAAATTGVVNSSFALASTTPHGTDPTVVLSTTIISGTPPTAVVWVPVGGPYVGDPAVVSSDGPSFHRQPTQVVFAVGPSGEPFFHERAGGAWSAAHPLGGLLDSDVAPAQTLDGPESYNFEVFGIGVDGAMWYRTRHSEWRSLGGAFHSQPTAVRFDGRSYVFAVGVDDALWYRTPTTGWASLGGIITSDLAVTTDGASLYVAGVGADEALWTRRLSGSTWTGWESRGGIVTSAPAGTYDPATGAGYLFAVGADGAIWYQGVTGGQWSGWYGLGGLAASEPAVVARVGGLDVFVVGGDLAMWRQRWNGSTWSGWQGHGGGFTSNPVATTTHVLGRGLDDWLYSGRIP